MMQDVVSTLATALETGDVAHAVAAALTGSLKLEEGRMPKAGRPPREGKVIISAWVDPEVRDNLKMMGIELKLSTQEILEKAVSDALAAHEKHRGKAKPKR